MKARKRRQPGLSLIELLVGVAIVGLLVMIAAPSFSRFIAVQRLRSISAALVTDIQFVRAEAASRNTEVVLKFVNDPLASTTCYVLLTGDHNVCNCNRTPGVDICSDSTARELRSVQVQRGQGVTVTIPPGQTVNKLLFEPATGRIRVATSDTFIPPTGAFLVDVEHPSVGVLRTSIEPTGRPSTCSPSGAVSGVPAC